MCTNEKWTECTHERNDKIISITENKKRFVLSNKSQKLVRQVRVDGCLIDDHTTARCDYLFEIDQPKRIVKYVELKGKDIQHAYDQLCNTLEQMKNVHSDRDKYCYIVAQRVPRSGPKVQVLKVMMKRSGVTLEIKTSEHKVKI